MEIDYKKLEDIGINIDDRDYQHADPQRMFCPKCHSEREHHPTERELAVYWDTCTAHCHHCGKDFFFGKTVRLNDGTSGKQKKQSTKEYKKPCRLTNEEAPKDEVLQWFANRGIPAEIVAKEPITQASKTLPQTKNIEKCILFSYYEEGELVNRKYRGVKQKHFMLEKDARLIPWRIDHIKKTTECIITEGEMDALSFIVAGYDYVISVPNGAQKNLTYLDDFIESHFENKSRIYIAADTDSKGLELRAELVRRFGEEKCRIVTYG